MKIALYNLTTTTKLGGVETFVWQTARHLAARGLSVDIIGGAGHARQDAPGVRLITHPFIDRETLRRIPLLGRQYGLTKLLERISFGFLALPSLVRAHYDIIHIQKPYDLPFGLIATRLSGARLLFGCHGKDFWPGDRLLAPFVDGAVSCSHFNAATVKERYNLAPDVIYNGCETDLFFPRPPDPTLRREYATDTEQLVLYVGRLVRWKGVEYLVQAAAQLPTGVRILIAGDGPYRDTLERLAESEGVQERIRFLGSVPHTSLPALYAVVDLVVGTSFMNETFGMALCDAMACGLPVVASDFGGFPEVVEDGVTGSLVPAQDPTALAGAINKLLADPALRAKMGEAGRTRVHALFTWAQVTTRLLAVYNHLLTRRSPKFVKEVPQ